MVIQQDNAFADKHNTTLLNTIPHLPTCQKSKDNELSKIGIYYHTKEKMERKGEVHISEISATIYFLNIANDSILSFL